MNKYLFSLSIPFMLMFTDVSAQQTTIEQVQWCTAAKLQNADGSTSLGFAGAINAVFNDALLVAGGANFPDKMPWEGGKKFYSNNIQILLKQGGRYVWSTKTLNAKLPQPIAYCGNTPTDSGVVYAGGEGIDGLSKKAFIISWDAAGLNISIKPLPDLPVAITNTGLTHIGNVVYLVGGDMEKGSSSAFYKLDLSDASWQELPSLPLQLANALVVAQSDQIFVIGGRTKTPSGISDLHNTTFAYDIVKGSWEKMADISDGKQTTTFSAGAGVAVSNNLILVTGGDSGSVFHKIENYISQISKATSQEEKDELTKEKNKLNVSHKGFYKEQLVYNIITNKWSKIGELPFPAHVTTTATKWGNDIVLSNGEIKPGVRTPSVMIGTIKIGQIKKKE